MKHIRVFVVTEVNRFVQLAKCCVRNGWKINLRKRKKFADRKRKRTTILNTGRVLWGRTIDGRKGQREKEELCTQISRNWLRNRVCTCGCAWCELSRENFVHIIHTSKNREKTRAHTVNPTSTHLRYRNRFEPNQESQTEWKSKRTTYQMSIENELRQHSMLQRTYDTHTYTSLAEWLVPLPVYVCVCSWFDCEWDGRSRQFEPCTEMQERKRKITFKIE